MAIPPCQCSFSLHSIALDTMSYHKEFYEMSCENAEKFLEKLRGDRSFITPHKVSDYTIRCGEYTYKSEVAETPAKAAAKIAAAMQNFRYLPIPK